MLENILGSLGSHIGKSLGGGLLSNILRFSGRLLGNYLTNLNFQPNHQYSFAKQIDNIHIGLVEDTKPIPLVYGKARVKGQIIWALDIREEAICDTELKYSRRIKKPSLIKHKTSYKYYADFALGIAEGYIDDLERVWINNSDADISDYQYRFYNGSNSQFPDILIQRHMGEGKTPAFKGLAYIVFENFPLEDFHNKIPYFEFEIHRNIEEDFGKNIQNINIIPASGEYVYDTEIVEKIVYSSQTKEELYRGKINSNNKHNIADALHNLNQLKRKCQNIKKVSVVVSWFGNSLEAENCIIVPAVESRGDQFSKDWKVGKYCRQDAYIISKNSDNIPNYGGTVCDSSLINYLRELKSRNITIILYPMIFIDLKDKPWRGHIKAISEKCIDQFFNRDQGYNNFILHYAAIAAKYADGIVIGSELKGLTTYNLDGIFPAVENLIILASQVKKILGPDKIVTYAADWSEYHHNDGFYHMDKLWACKYIDVIGIDAYFPITESKESNISEEEIKNGWNSGEGYDYYLSNEQRLPLEAKWAWKNLEYWWKNHHIDKNGKATDWIPKSKKIWFTELGFASIDKSTNQPNVFYDPMSSDGGLPKYSNGNIDFAIQRRAIKTSLEYWKNSEFIDEIFLWAWDARPYPAFPYYKIWNDSYLWSRGHYLNGKLENSSLSTILIDLCKRADIPPSQISINNINERVEGIIFDKDISIFDAISLLRSVYFFDIWQKCSNIIEFKSNIYDFFSNIESKNIVRDNGLFQVKEQIFKDNISNIVVSYSDAQKDYLIIANEYMLDNKMLLNRLYLNLPITMEENIAKQIAYEMINKAIDRNNIISIRLLSLEISQLIYNNCIQISYDNLSYEIQIYDIKFTKLYCDIEGFIITKNHVS